MSRLRLPMSLLLIAAASVNPPFLARAGEKKSTDRTFYVSTEGNDGWSGRLARPNADRSDGPVASFGRALAASRRARAAGQSGQSVVQVRGGTYCLSEPITFQPDDSDTSLVAFPGEKPELLGGPRIKFTSRDADGTLRAELPDVRTGKWCFRQLFVDGNRQVRARYPNPDPTDPCRKGFLYTARGAGEFGLVVGNIHNRGDWMEYRVQVPSDGQYNFWIYYGAQNKPFGHSDMGGRTTLSVDGGQPVPLMNLPDTGAWHVFRWSHSATLHLAKGPRRLRWQNVSGGGLSLEAYAISDDPAWKPVDTRLPKPGPGRHAIVIQAENFVRYEGRQLSVSGVAGNPTEFHFDPGTFKPSWAAAPGAEIHIFQSGSCRAFKEIVSIRSVDPQARTVTVGGRECVAPLGIGDRYFVENVAEELDSPGEWYLDRSSGVLSYRPVPTFNDRSEIVAPRVGRAIQVLGDAARKRPVRGIRIAGLVIRDTDYSPDDGCVGYGMGSDGCLYLANAEQCTIENCTFRNTGKYAVCLAAGRGNTVRGNDIAQSAEGGVLLLRSAGNQVVDNHIHHLGAVYKHIGGVILEGAGTDDNRVAHNWVHHSSRYGISLKNPGRRNVIEYNRVETTNTETYDTGGIEVTQGDRQFRSGSAIRHNVVADTIGYSSQGTEPVFLSWGIYLDSFAGGYEVSHNVVYRSHNGGIMLQGGKDNRVTNNVFVDGDTCQGFISNFAQNSTGLVLERNVFCYRDPKATLFAVGRLAPDVISVDHNLYWHGAHEVRNGWGARETLAPWRARGFDQHSIVADPRFVDAEHDNYALRGDSPAFKLGFQPIDTSQVGPRRPAKP